ncbi:MAG: acetyl-CoA carboxylase biotin carboxylase subunit [bacterium]|nr:acetyl-CoA carboxylase biotin carboxylase subunit [bacterium]
MFSKVLIANRGEIALRVIHTCRSMGVKTVAIYSEADEQALHVQEADEAVAIGGYTPRESYLIAQKVLDAAIATQCDAIHPGYGFLSENAEFARMVAEAGMTFIGPTPEAIAMLGDKTAAREIAIAANVPVSPGSDGAVADIEDARRVVERIGMPVIIKAAAGGGGKGMRIVEKMSEVEAAFRSAQNEAVAAFNDGRVFIERYIQQPRHIEIQVLADNNGTVLYFPERECSIQRRHQKVIEESPSTAVTPAVRKAMGEAAARLVQDAKYTNAGTIEFLLDAKGEFYFMEVNTRLQVEHPVTEMVTGVDFVEQQLRIAAGEPLTMKQEDIAVPHGHAIECRVCAEDVFNDFLPDTGAVSFMQLPEGDGIRNDSALYEGYAVTVHYDPMVAKLIIYADNREACIEKTIKALDNYHVAGFKTTIPFCRLVIDTPEFRSGNYSTFFVKEHWPLKQPESFLSMLAGAAASGFVQEITRRTPIEQPTDTNAIVHA